MVRGFRDGQLRFLRLLLLPFRFLRFLRFLQVVGYLRRDLVLHPDYLQVLFRPRNSVEIQLFLLAVCVCTIFAIEMSPPVCFHHNSLY